MMHSLQLVFDVLRGAKLTLKPWKCTFGFKQLDYLGFTISKGVIKPGRKVEVISSYPRPGNEHEVRRYLGLTGYFRRFIVGYATMSDPLTQLTRKDVPFAWGKVHEEAFKQLKEKLCSEPVVRMYSSWG